MVNDIVVPASVPVNVSTPTGDVIVPDKAPFEGFSVVICNGSGYSVSA